MKLLGHDYVRFPGVSCHLLNIPQQLILVPIAHCHLNNKETQTFQHRQIEFSVVPISFASSEIDDLP